MTQSATGIEAGNGGPVPAKSSSGTERGIRGGRRAFSSSSSTTVYPTGTAAGASDPCRSRSDDDAYAEACEPQLAAAASDARKAAAARTLASGGSGFVNISARGEPMAVTKADGNGGTVPDVSGTSGAYNDVSKMASDPSGVVRAVDQYGALVDVIAGTATAGGSGSTTAVPNCIGGAWTSHAPEGRG